MKKLLATTLLSLSLSSSFACDIHGFGKGGIVPENNLKIPVGLKAAGGISEASFNKVIDRVTSLYAKKVISLGGKLVVERNWTDGTVNAYAKRDETGKIWTLAMFGGLARHPQITEDAFAVVVCHELGHQLGGAPRKKDATGKPYWASNEGQADYFANLKCLRKYFNGQNNQSAVAKVKVPAEVTKKCQSIYANAEEIAVCQRSAMAGQALGNFFRVLENTKTAVNFSTPDKTIVKVTDDNHPHAQCRLDTYYQASLCDKDINEELSDTDANVGTCTVRNGDKIGNRPGCWFAAEK